jgi:hypothetical protein
MDTQVAGLITNEAVREFCGNQLCTVLHGAADQATGVPANLLMQSP